jgi:transcriptional regulator with PAS, ATPase and Fis domain
VWHNGDTRTLEAGLRARESAMPATLHATGSETDRLRALNDLRAALVATRDARALFSTVCSIAGRVIRHDEARLVLFTPGVNDVHVFVPAGSSGVTAGLSGPEAGLGEDSTEPGVFPVRLSSGEQGSGVRAPVRLDATVGGIFRLISHRPREYTDDDVFFVQLLADQIAGALVRQRLTAMTLDAALERERAANLETSEQLLQALANVLDIRLVFPQISEITRQILPHDRLTMTFLDGQGACVMQAASNDVGPLAVRATGVDTTHLTDGFFRIVDDLTQYVKPGVTYDPPDHHERLIAAGYRSVLSICLSAREQRFVLQFWSKQGAAFRATQVPIARRIAEHVALAVSHEQLAETARHAADVQARAELLEARVRSLSEELDSRSGYGRIVGPSEPWKNVLRAATQVASTDTTVLLTGESGTGKEVVARFIHRASARSQGPFVAVNCAALPEPLLESELFGHERGAFTGAEQTKPGQIELATGGVLFLDEVGEMSPSAQAKFLRVLQEREFQRLGGTRPIKANVRVIAATNRELRQAMERGDFREDLYYRLQVFGIRLPPLRERPEDILPLSAAFLEEIGRSFGRPPAGMTYEAKQALVHYAWRGNVRQLRNVLERAAIVCDGGLIAPEHLSLDDERPSRSAGTSNVKIVERQMIERVLRESGGNKSKAARRLGLTRKQLYVRLRTYEREGVREPQ